MEDVYSGPGLKGVPRGTVKALRLFTYHFGYQRLAGIDHRVGADGPWEAKRVLGTVPVEADGSALFHVPAKTPISFQPLDAEGKAVALMRSWMSAHARRKRLLRGLPRPPERRATGHEPAPRARPARPRNHALARPGARLQFRARCPARARQVLRGLPRRRDPASGDGATKDAPNAPTCAATRAASWSIAAASSTASSCAASKQDLLGKYGAVFDPSYVALRQFVRVGGLESDLHLLPPREFARRHQRADPDARQGPPQREARRRSLGPAGHLDRPQRALPRHLGRDHQDPRRPMPAPARTAHSSMAAWWRTAKKCPTSRPTTSCRSR